MKEVSSSDLLHRMRRAAVARGAPDRVMIELTYRCNFRCGYCYIPRARSRTPQMSYRSVCSVLRQISRMGCTVVGFTGGEPFLRPDMLKIITFAKRCGLEVVVHTNASLIDDRICRALARLRLNKVDVSVNALDPKTFERISGVKGSFAKVMASLRRLSGAGIPLGVKTCLLPANAGQVKKIETFARSLGAMHRLDTKLFRQLDGAVGGSDSCAYEVSMRAAVQRGAGRMRKKDFFRCGIGRTQAAITPDGKLKWCLLIDYPRLTVLGGGFARAWAAQKVLFKRQVRKGVFICGKCDVLAGCSPCPAYGWLVRRNFFACPPEARRRAQVLMGDA